MSTQQPVVYLCIFFFYLHFFNKRKSVTCVFLWFLRTQFILIDFLYRDNVLLFTKYFYINTIYYYYKSVLLKILLL